MKSLHLLEEISKNPEMESEDATYEPKEYNLENPDLELQYLDTEANLMEIKQGPTLEEDDDLYSVTHANCAYDKCTNWDKSFASGWQPMIEET